MARKVKVLSSTDKLIRLMETMKIDYVSSIVQHRDEPERYVLDFNIPYIHDFVITAVVDVRKYDDESLAFLQTVTYRHENDIHVMKQGDLAAVEPKWLDDVVPYIAKTNPSDALSMLDKLAVVADFIYTQRMKGDE